MKALRKIRSIISGNNASDKSALGNGYHNRLKPLLIFLLIFLIIGIGSFLWLQRRSPETATFTTGPEETGNTRNIEAAQITYTEAGFEPQTVRIEAGQTVSWTNKRAAIMTIASDPHPEHSLIDGFISEDIDQDDSYSFTFKEKGTFTYHDEASPLTGGTIIVD